MEIDNLTFSFDKVLNICMVGNFAHFFLLSAFFFKNNIFKKNSFIPSVSNSWD